MSMARVDPRVRACGKARIDITRRAVNEQDWQRLWKEPRYPFPFQWGQGWKQAFQYQVDDYAAEIGFLMDVLGLPVCAFSPSYALFTSPDQEFAFGVVAAPEGNSGTPPETIRIQFMVEDLVATAAELERRGVRFEEKTQPDTHPGPPVSSFQTPHGVAIDLLGAVWQPAEYAAENMASAENLASAEVQAAEEWLAVGSPDEEGIPTQPDDNPWTETEPALSFDSQSEPEPEPSIDTGFAPEEPGQAVDDDENPFAGFSFTAGPDPEPKQAFDPPPQEIPSNPREQNPGDEQPGAAAGRRNSSSGGVGRRPAMRRSDPFPRASVVRRPGAPRANGGQHWPDSLRRPAHGSRKNPFDIQDLPPLPDIPPEMPPFLEASTGQPQAWKRVEPNAPEMSAPSAPDRSNGVGPSGLKQETFDQLLQPSGEDEPRYEDLDDEETGEIDDLYAS